MKLGSLKGGRNGRLVVVSRDLKRMLEVHDVAPSLQAALDDWDETGPALRASYEALNEGKTEGKAFDPAGMAAPLPRAYQWVDGSAYLYHVELVRKARGAEMPPDLYDDPLMYQGASDGNLGPTDDILAVSESHGIDFEAEVAVITGDVPMGVTPEEARRYIRLVMLVNDISLRGLIPQELGKGFGFLNGKPASAFSPVAVTPEELGAAWDGGKVSLPLVSTYNGEEFGHPNAGKDLAFDFPRLIAHAAKTRALAAGTIVGSGTVSNRDPSSGSSCLAERRMVETIERGAPETPFMRFGDTIRIEMFNRDGKSIFGAINQKIVEYRRD